MKLNEWQQAVVDDLVSGPVVVEACPGSGKTATTEDMVAALVQSGVPPMRILVVTFTTKAAAESRVRVARKLFPDIQPDEIEYFKDPYNRVASSKLSERVGDIENWLASDDRRRMIAERFSTIHALSLRTLKALGYEFTVLAPPQQGQRGDIWWNYQTLVKDGIKELDWEVSPRTVEWWFGAAVNSFVEAADAEEWFMARFAERSDPMWQAPKMAELYKRYRGYCKQHQALDFNMMQAQLLKVINTYPSKRREVEAMFDVVVVDEAQDTDPIQCEILWTMGAGRVAFVGDVDQSCYAFRGAEPEVMRLLFEARFPNAKRFNLPINYRSTQTIVRVTAGLIADNYGGELDRYLKPFQARPDAPEGEPIEYQEFSTFGELTDEVANLVKENPGAWFILNRTRAECARIHTDLIAKGVPAVNKSGGLLFGAPHVRKVLAYARLACNYQNARDDIEILSEIANVSSTEYRAPMTRRRHVEGCHEDRVWINCGCPMVYEEGIDLSPVRFYGRKGIEKAGGTWAGIVRQQQESNRGGYPTVNAKASRDLVQFVTKTERLTDDAKACLGAIIHGSVMNWLKHDQGIDDEDLAENGKAEDFDLLLGMADPDTTMEQYLQKVDTLSKGSFSGDESESALIGTVHWSKGAERSNVVVNTTRLPIVPPKTKPGQLSTTPPPTTEEERRLLFVAMTRAMNEVHLVGSLEWNNGDTNRSEFVQAMIDKGLIEFEDDNLTDGGDDGSVADAEETDGEGDALPATAAVDFYAFLKATSSPFPDSDRKDEGIPCGEMGSVLRLFPKVGEFEGTIYKPSAWELAAALPDFTPAIDGNELVFEKELGGGSTLFVRSSIKVGQAAEGTGQDSIRVTRRDVSERGTFWFKDQAAWVNRWVPKDATTREVAVAHIVGKIRDNVAKIVRECPACGKTQILCGSKGKQWWKGIGGCRCK